MTETSTRQFVRVRFNPWDRKSYTYHWDGAEPLRDGELVQVETARGLELVRVIEVGLAAPTAFA
ncbi:MAG: hypothetical protein ACRDD1_02420, partial [Planctomycetia bacterium]